MASRGRPKKATNDAGTPRTLPAIPAELTHFDKLPDSAHVRLPVVRGLYACSDSGVWRNVKLGNIPHPKKLGARMAAWNVGELRQALGRAS